MEDRREEDQGRITRHPGYLYTGTFLSELAAASRTSITVKCECCAHSRTIPLADLIAEHNDVVMLDALNRIVARVSLTFDCELL